MLDKIKTALGIRSGALDNELIMLIDAAIADLQLCGVRRTDENDPLIITAVACFCQANRGSDPEKNAAFTKLYNARRRQLMNAREYTP